MERKKILLVAYNDLGLGGIQNVMMTIVRHLSDEFLFDIVCFDSERTNFDAEFESFGGKIFRVEKKYRNSFTKRLDFYIRGGRIRRAIRKIILENGPYIAVHSHKAWENGLILRVAKRCGVPARIAHAHTAFDSKYHPIAGSYMAYLKRLTAKNATALVACSKKAGKNLFGENAAFHTVYNTVDERFLQDPPTPPVFSAPVLLQVGMICHNKNQLFSIDVLSALKAIYPNAELYFIGEAKDAEMEAYFAHLKARILELGVADAVRFLPAADVKAEMSKSTYVIFPSFFEGLGIVPIEAQATGMKCFVSDSVTKEIDCGGCTFLSLTAGAKAWASAIDSQFQKDHGARAEYDMTRFRQEVIMEQYRKLYKGEFD